MFLPLCLLLSVLNWCLCIDLTYFVEEGKDPGTLVGNIAADSHLMDRIPLDERNTITFSQLRGAQTGSTQLFRVSEKSGKLYTLHTLDAELMCKRYQECSRFVEVAVQKGTSFIKVLEIKVILKDVNDFQPEFPIKQVNIQFSEGDAIGMRKSIPNAIDKDVGSMNSKITYKLMKNMNDPFSLSVSKRVDGTAQLFINLEEKLDREMKDSYMIQVVAKDGGSPPKQSELDVNITVTDVNDNLPIFSQKVYNVTIKNEPSDNLPVAILSASDFDIGKNGRVSYEFSLQTSDIAKVHFKLNKVTGEVFLHKKFTLGQELVHKLYVKATDGGSPPLSSIVMILVNVINQQNNAPTIDVNFVSRSMGKENTVAISEDIEVGSFIAYVKVTDHDAGQNGELSCILHHDKFQLQSLGPKRYKVLVKKPLDRETQDHHDVIISCQDKGSPPLHCESKFSIKVMDVNDVQPTFAKKTFKFWIYENEKPNFPVGYINATDPDLGSGSKLTYFLLADNKYFLPFQITDNGLISTVMSLDHEFQDVYEFQVLVKDKGRPSLNNTVNVIVEVRDENDNSPYFMYPSVNPFSLDVIYYPHHTKNITVLKASDSDGRENAFLKYEITDGNDKQLFTINPYTGLLSFTRVVTQQDAGSYDLQFAVKDSGTPVLSATTTIFLTLTVSNKTFEMINVVQMKADEADEKIHLDFLIAIVSVAVTLSVIITAFISICFLRLTNQKNISHRTEGNCSVKCEQRQLMYPYLATSCNDLPSTRIEEVDINRDFHLMERGDSQRGDNSDNGQSGSATIMHLQATPEVVYQEIGAMSWGRKGKRTTLVVPNNQREISMLSSHSDSVDDWNKGDTTHNHGETQVDGSQVSVLQYMLHKVLFHHRWFTSFYSASGWFTSLCTVVDDSQVSFLHPMVHKSLFCGR
ncbi:PCDHGB [Acanthosepion pharaonis]|uniref:PCDHGB n=1 Tax=Acanthosepion pharaonis TaxID=158019 RepID=A0A812BJ93_ACAPH|nr:PCDHGB [Sepia pharaonis]